MLKRYVDIIGASTLLIVSAPVLIASAIAIWLSLGLPIIFKQERAGYRGRLFTLYKFRTMRADRQASRLLSLSERINRVGEILRTLSIDELPQLWNVLKGDMSLIGPRPLLSVYLSRYNECQAQRHEMKPGMTGYAQVVGRHALTWEEKFDLDVWYITHWSPSLDCKIALMTVWAVLSAKNSDRNAVPSEPEFLGTPLGTARAELKKG